MTLNTKWFEVKGCRITNNRIRKKFIFIDSIGNQIITRTLH